MKNNETQSFRTKKEKSERIEKWYKEQGKYTDWDPDERKKGNLIIGFDSEELKTRSISPKQLKRMSWDQKVKWGIPVCVCCLLNTIEFLGREMVGEITLLHSKDCSAKWVGNCERALVGDENTINWTEKKNFGYQSVGATLEWVRVKNNSNE